MFGYVRCFAPELRLREYEYYRGAYCGLCRSMGRCTGCLSRITLNYDIVFLALVRMALSGEHPDVRAARCVVHPLKKRPVCSDCGALDYAAKAGAILGWHNHADDLTDTRGTKRWLLYAASPVLRSGRKRCGELSELDRRIGEGIEELRMLEAKEEISADELADASGRMLAEVFAYGLPEKNGRIAWQIGYHTGRWVYLADAVDDYKKDIKSGEFNPFRHSGLPCDEAVRAALTSEMAATEAATDLLSDDCPHDIRELIGNILYLGSERTVAQILERRGKRERGRRVAAEASEKVPSGGKSGKP